MSVTIKHTDALTLLKSLPPQSIDLIATDPPYYRVKKDAWDNQWESEADFLAWCESIAIEFKRVLKPNGSLYWFAGDKLASRIEMEVRKHLIVKNHIVWYKPTGKHKCVCKRMQRSYFPSTERVIFAVASETEGKENNKRYSEACEPLIAYFRGALVKAQLTQSQVNQYIGNKMSSHWFGRSQWRLPNREYYEKLQVLMGDALLRGYDELVAERNELLRNKCHGYSRIFDVDQSVFNTDMWISKPVQYYEGKHPCEKPQEIMQHIIKTSSREGDLVLDPFVGGGATAVAAKALGRRFIGCELDDTYVKQARSRIDQ